MYTSLINLPIAGVIIEAELQFCLYDSELGFFADNIMPSKLLAGRFDLDPLIEICRDEIKELAAKEIDKNPEGVEPA